LSARLGPAVFESPRLVFAWCFLSCIDAIAAAAAAALSAVEPDNSFSAPPRLSPQPAAMVYITSDLFGPNTPHERQYDDSPNYWHAMAHQQHAAGLGKRKRMAADDGPQQ
jgi:hypothetical protein